ncbi:putative membrane protein YtaF [Lentibacillus sp. JNUCC-1]|uniref:sporulation membrane protein YtaF n=1 Tax=Lentibacillus sp. JNUCC-1 TaxID=2654513 RepID=UPI0012E9741C|nr:sporulation membrane protein YtaF [Lentibacillus sp. JNUCC-1]MUV39005.1 putative membrane protein YtaF [Lentibacillus sp. JNUCC-1]
MALTGLLFLVIAVSIDGFGVGITYGMQKIRLPLFGTVIIMLCSGAMVLLSMTIGDVLRSYIDPMYTTALGGLILVFLGCFSLYNILRSKKDSTSKGKNTHVLKSILDDPHAADLDQSGSISAREALLLGSALALDAFGAGLGAAMIGYSPWLTAGLIGLMSGVFVYLGISIGIILSQKRLLKNLTYIPPVLLMIIGMVNVFK